MYSTNKIGFVLCLLIFLTFPMSGKSETDDELPLTRLMALERIVFNQVQVIEDQETQFSNYEKRLANQKKLMDG